MFEDPFKDTADSVIAPAQTCFAIIPNDSSDLPQATKAIYIGQGGDVTLRAVSADQDVIFRNLASGTILDVRIRSIRAAGTTASDIVGLA